MRISRVLRLVWRPIAVIAAIYGVTVTGFIWSQGVSIYNGIYWGIITMSTVGYGDIVPTNPVSKAFTMGLALSTIGVIGYSVSTVTTLALQAREAESLGLDGTRMKGHTLVLGWTPVSRAALQELLLQGRKIAVMTRQQELLAEIRPYVASVIRMAQKDPQQRQRVSREQDVFVALGDYSERGALDLLNISEAREAIVASSDDSRNVMTALILKELAPHLRIVVAVLREELRKTLNAAGVTYVISPSDLGGRMVSMAATEPEVALAFDDLTTTSYGSTMEQFLCNEKNPLTGMTFDEAFPRLRKATGALLVGVAKPRPPEMGSRIRFQVDLDPSPQVRLENGDYALVISSLRSLDALHQWIRVPPGRTRD